jgi:hypothetical protein
LRPLEDIDAAMEAEGLQIVGMDENRVSLSSVPSDEWDAIAVYGFDSVWLMGIWERSPAGIAIANQNQSLLDDFWRALPDFSPNDNVGSPYC